jgi:ZIP family zinc transporter
MVLLFGLAAFLATLLGGLFALKWQDKLHLILGFSAGAVLGVALFDLLPESIDLTSAKYSVSDVTLAIAVGFFLYMFLSRVLLLHPHSDSHDQEECHHRAGSLGAISLSLHSFLDGVGIGLAFKVSPSVGLIVAVAVLTHDFSDGINTVGIVLKNKGKNIRAFRWLLLDAAAPFLGVASTFLFTLSNSQLGLVLAVFCGLFLYIGASDLLPESHHRHPKTLTGIMNILGAAVIYAAIYFAGI